MRLAGGLDRGIIECMTGRADAPVSAFAKELPKSKPEAAPAATEPQPAVSNLRRVISAFMPQHFNRSTLLLAKLVVKYGHVKRLAPHSVIPCPENKWEKWPC